MPWPKSTDYVEAVQNLPLAMSDEELRGGQLAVNQLGLPMAWSGGVADVYKIHNARTGNTWALKCFTKKIEGQAERYRYISAHLAKARLPFLVDFRYLDRGIRVQSEWYPAIKMHWVEGGIRLNEFVEQYLNRPRTLRQLLRIWAKMAARLRQANIGHCDLQHGNVLLAPRSGGSLALRLIDYDGVHVPALAGTRSPELGHPAFQHPQRKSDRVYSVDVDRFSHLVIYTGIHCLTVGREKLWKRFNNDENLLFRESDFQHPGRSDVFRTLWKLPDVDSRALVGRLALACELPLEQAPLLEEAADGEVRPLTSAEQDAVESLLGRAPSLHATAVAESTEVELGLAMPARAEPVKPLSSAELVSTWGNSSAEAPPIQIPRRETSSHDSPSPPPLPRPDLPRPDPRQIRTGSNPFRNQPSAGIQRQLRILAGFLVVEGLCNLLEVVALVIMVLFDDTAPPDAVITMPIVSGLLFGLPGLIMIVGGVNIWQRRSLSLAKTGLIVSAIPCLSICCVYIVALPICIWGMKLLSYPQVQLTFSDAGPPHVSRR